MYFIKAKSKVGWHTLILKHLGQTKERKTGVTGLTVGLGIIVMTMSLKTLRMTRLRRRVLLLALPEPRGGA